MLVFFFFSSRRRHTRSLRDWSSDVCSSDLLGLGQTKNLGGLDLGQALAADDFRDLPNQPRLDQHFLGVRVAEVGVHIAATFVNLDAFNHLRSTFAHLPAPWRAWRPLSTCS